MEKYRDVGKSEKRAQAVQKIVEFLQHKEALGQEVTVDDFYEDSVDDFDRVFGGRWDDQGRY